jgi:hypothetical protein
MMPFRRGFHTMINKLIAPPDFDLNGQPLPANHSHTLSEYESYRITDTTEIKRPIPVIKISGETISTPEAITVISGAPKSGKSAFCSILIAGAICSGEIDGLAEVEVLANDTQKAVIHVDTEQAPWKQQANQKTILRRATLNSCPPFYLSYNLRKLEIEEMQTTLTNICEAADKQFSGIHSIFIDGLADFIRDPNDQAASFDIVKYFEALAQTHFTSVIVVIHTNKGSDSERGHLGSQVQRKAEGILSVKKEGEISYLDPKLLRHASDDIPKIQFRYNYEKGFHTQCEVDSPQDKKVNEKILKMQIVCEKVFSGQKSYQYKDAISAIMRETAKSLPTAKSMFSEMKAHEMIIQGDDNFWRETSRLV